MSNVNAGGSSLGLSTISTCTKLCELPLLSASPMLKIGDGGVVPDTLPIGTRATDGMLDGGKALARRSGGALALNFVRGFLTSLRCSSVPIRARSNLLGSADEDRLSGLLWASSIAFEGAGERAIRSCELDRCTWDPHVTIEGLDKREVLALWIAIALWVAGV